MTDDRHGHCGASPGWHKSYPRLQLITVREFDGRYRLVIGASTILFTVRHQ
jgi:hypothetical protein